MECDRIPVWNLQTLWELIQDSATRNDTNDTPPARKSNGHRAQKQSTRVISRPHYVSPIPATLDRKAQLKTGVRVCAAPFRSNTACKPTTKHVQRSSEAPIATFCSRLQLKRAAGVFGAERPFEKSGDGSQEGSAWLPTKETSWLWRIPCRGALVSVDFY